MCQNSVFVKFWGCQKRGFRKENCIFCFCLFYIGEIETEKRKTNKMEKAKKPYKIGFLRWSSKNVKKQKNGFLAKIAGREKKRAFSCTLSVWAKIFLEPKQCKPGKTIKIVVSAEIAQNQK